jgi:uncharacterized protein YggU (UPF0235/DUF167 family)
MKIAIVAYPNSKKPRIEKDLFNALHVYVNEPPLGGKANNAVRASLADYFKVKKSSVFLISGEKSKHKVFEITKY